MNTLWQKEGNIKGVITIFHIKSDPNSFIAKVENKIFTQQSCSRKEVKIKATKVDY